ELRSALQKAGVKIKYIAGICLASRWSAKQQRNFAVRRRLFRKIVIDHERMTTRVAEMLAQGCSGIRRNKLKRGRVGSRCRNDRRKAHRALLFELRFYCRDRRSLLANGDINTIDGIDSARRGLRSVCITLVDDRIDSDRGLTRLAIADNELALAAADRDHAVDSLDAGLERLFHGLPLHDA